MKTGVGEGNGFENASWEGGVEPVRLLKIGFYLPVLLNDKTVGGFNYSFIRQMFINLSVELRSSGEQGAEQGEQENGSFHSFRSLVSKI